MCLSIFIFQCLIPQVLPQSPFPFIVQSFPKPANLGPIDLFRFHKRSYVDLQCRGMYDPQIFSELEEICEDCYHLNREPEVHGMCR